MLSVRSWATAAGCLFLLAAPQITVAQPKASPPPVLPKAPTPAPAPAPAESPPPLVGPKTDPTPADVAKARSIFDAGGRAYEGGDFVTAIQAFEQAYAISGRESIVFSIAQAHRQEFVVTGDAEHLVKAIAAYRQFLASGKVGSHRGEATKALADLETIAASRTSMPQGPVMAPTEMKTMISIDSPTPGAMISIDGGDAAPPQVSKEVPEGEHHVKLTAPGYLDKDVAVHINKGQFTAESFELDEQPAKLTLDVPSGADVSIDGRFVAKAPITRALELPSGKRFVSVALVGHESAGQVVALDRGEQKALVFTLPSTAQRKASYGLFITAGAGTVAAGVLAGVALANEVSAKNIATTSKTQTISPQDAAKYNGALDTRNTYRAAAIATGVASGAVAVLGIALFALDRPRNVDLPPDLGSTKPTEPKKTPKPPGLDMKLDPWFSPDTAGLGVRGVF